MQKNETGRFTHSFRFLENDKRKFVEFGQLLGYQFNDIKLLLQALTRQSAIQENPKFKEIGSFQRLEFLGDKILSLAVADILMEANPHWSEGELTIATATYVNNNGPLIIVAGNLGLQKMLVVGRGEQINCVQKNKKVLSDAVEALLGALFIDCGKNYKTFAELIKKHWQPLGLSQKTFPCTQKQDELDNELIVAITSRDETLTERLLSLGADPNIVINETLQEGCGLVDLTAFRNRLSLLQIAIREWLPLNIINSLLKYGANPNWQCGSFYIDSDNQKSSVLDSDSTFVPKLEEVVIIIRHRQEMPSRLRLVNHRKTALHFLMEEGPLEVEIAAEIAKLLLNYGANPSLNDFKDNSALDIETFVNANYFPFRSQIPFRMRESFIDQRRSLIGFITNYTQSLSQYPNLAIS